MHLIQSPLSKSPAKRRYDLLSKGSNTPTTPPSRQNLFPSRPPTQSLMLASKNQSQNLVSTMLFSMEDNSADGSGCSDSPTVPVLVPSLSAPDIQSQRAQLDRESHQNRLLLENKVKQDKKTADTYRRVLNRYEKWWKEDQARRASEASGRWIIEDPHPITALKASIYLAYDTTRPKVSNSLV